MIVARSSGRTAIARVHDTRRAARRCRPSRRVASSAASVRSAPGVDVGERDDVPQRRTLAANRRDLRRLLGVRHEDRHRARIAQDVRDLIARQIRIDRHVGDAEHEASVVGDRPLGPILRENRDAIAGAHAELLEPERRAAHALGERVVRDRLVLARRA